MRPNRGRGSAGAGRLLGLLASAAALAPAGAAADGDVAQGRIVANQCGVCHGLDGIATAPEAPNIGGERAFYIEHQLKQFRDGGRTHPLMSIVAQGLSDEDIANVAAYYAAIVIEVVSVPE